MRTILTIVGVGCLLPFAPLIGAAVGVGITVWFLGWCVVELAQAITKPRSRNGN